MPYLLPNFLCHIYLHIYLFLPYLLQNKLFVFSLFLSVVCQISFFPFSIFNAYDFKSQGVCISFPSCYRIMDSYNWYRSWFTLFGLIALLLILSNSLLHNLTFLLMEFGERGNIGRLSLFSGLNYAYWQSHMQVFCGLKEAVYGFLLRMIGHIQQRPLLIISLSQNLCLNEQKGK